MAILPIDAKRYGTHEMTCIFEEQRKVDYQLQIEGAAALAQGKIGMIPLAAAKDISKSASSGRVTVARIKQLEKKSDHDTAALVESLGERCKPKSRPWIHFGLTSNDLVDTSNSMQMRDALRIIQPKIAKIAIVLADRAFEHRKLAAVGRTHGQHASIISFGLKFANWAHEMTLHLERLDDIKPRVLVCKTLGVVGTGSLMGQNAIRVQAHVAKLLDLHPATVATQVVARERYAEYVFGLSLVGSTLEKIAVEIRNLQRTEIGEVAERFKKGQMGSSAVPVKKNPIKSERVSSLSKLLRSNIGVSLENIPLWHERDLSNSANERFVLPTVSILLDEMLETMLAVTKNLTVDKNRIRDNLAATRGQIFAEFVLKRLIGNGMPRFEAYRHVQRVAFEANRTGLNYSDALKNDTDVSAVLSDAEIDATFIPETHLGASLQIISNVRRSVSKACKKFI